MAEDLVLQYYMRQSYILEKQRWKTPFAEIDFALRSPAGHLLLVEVKTLPNDELLSVRMSRRQKSRLQRAYQWVLEHEPAEFHFAVVSREQKITVLTEVLNIS